LTKTCIDVFFFKDNFKKKENTDACLISKCNKYIRRSKEPNFAIHPRLAVTRWAQELRSHGSQDERIREAFAKTVAWC